MEGPNCGKCYIHICPVMWNSTVSFANTTCPAWGIVATDKGIIQTPLKQKKVA
jgi:hypothetical protein